MMYALKDLLKKMGAPGVGEKGRVEWHYFDKDKKDIAGYADVRLEAQGERLVAFLRHERSNHEDDDGRVHGAYVETFFLEADHVGEDRYQVRKMGFDGDCYENPQKPVIELGLSIFHARALDISIRMVEQMFNKQDILEGDILPETGVQDKKVIFAKGGNARTRQESFGVVVPFRPRIANANSRAS